MKGCDDTPNPRDLLSKADPSFTPGALPPIPWPVAPAAAGAVAAPVEENKEVVEIKQRNPDKNPTKQDVADAVVKADRDMADALKTAPGAPVSDPELTVDKANLKPDSKSDIAGPAELAKAAVKVDVIIKKEEAKAAVVAEELTAEKAKAAAEKATTEAANKAEDAAKAEAVKAEKKAEEAKAAVAVAEKVTEEVKKEAANAKADAKIEEKAAAADKEAAKDLPESIL